MHPDPVFEPELARLRPAARLVNARQRGEPLFGCWQCGALVSDSEAPPVLWAGQAGRWCPGCWSALTADAARDRAAGDADPGVDPPLTPAQRASGAGLFGYDAAAEWVEPEPPPAVSWAAEYGYDDPDFGDWPDWADLGADEAIPADDCLAGLRGAR